MPLHFYDSACKATLTYTIESKLSIVMNCEEHTILTSRDSTL